MAPGRTIVVVLKGYPRLSETFIAQELRGLEQAGLDLVLVALRKPTDTKRHPVHDEIRAPVRYLPEYLHDEPWRVARALAANFTTPGFWRALRHFAGDLPLDLTRNRVRRFGQALVLAAEWPKQATWLHAHFIHTPASVAAYASLMLGIPWTASAHAKDIWTSTEHDLRRKLDAARWVVTCTFNGYMHLRSLSADPNRVHLSYHGLDLARFGHFDGPRSNRNGSFADRPVTILSVGRAVDKKGYDTLLQALALLPKKLVWRFVHVGGGEKLDALKALAERLGIADRIEWKGALAQDEVLALYRQADLFALACRVASDGDRDGLPNVLVEASSQGLACISTGISGVPELIEDGINGMLVAPDDAAALSQALHKAITQPAFREAIGRAAEQRVREHFDYRSSVRQLKILFEQEWRKTP